MADWQILYNYGGSDRDISGYWRNVSGSPVVSAAPLASGAASFASPIAGVYRFTFESPSTVSCDRQGNQDVSNPLLFSGTRSVTADGATVNLNLLPGWGVVLSSFVGSGDTFEIGVGCYLDTDLMHWQRVLSFGPRLKSYASGSREVTAKNISGVELTDCVVVVTNAARVENDQAADRPFYAFYQQGLLNPTADADLDGMAVTFDNYTAGSPATVDILVDGDILDIYDVTNSALMPDGVGLNCDDTTVYRFVTGSKYQSVHFILSSSLTETDTATFYVSDGGDAVKISIGSGTAVSGPSGLVLTESGQDAGTVTDDGEVDIQLVLDPDAYSSTTLNARSFSFRVQGMDGTTPVCVEHQGSFFLALGEAPLNFRITAAQEKYPRPHYSPDPGNPGEYISDDEGLYVRSEQDPRVFLLATEDPSGGYYASYGSYLSANGVIIT